MKNCSLLIENVKVDSEQFMQGYTGAKVWYHVVAWNKLYKKEVLSKFDILLGKKTKMHL